jgi:Peptidase family S41
VSGTNGVEGRQRPSAPFRFERIVRAFAIACTAALIAAAPYISLIVPPEDIAAENARWASLGLRVPPGGVVSSHPYAPPTSNRAYVVPGSWYRSFSDAQHGRGVWVSASALRDDLPILHDVLRTAYSGYEPAATRGWKWDAWFDAWGIGLAGNGDRLLTLDEAFSAWGSYERVQQDNRSGVPGIDTFRSGSASARLATEPHAPCTVLVTDSGSRFALVATDAGQQPHAVTAWDGTVETPGWYVSYPANRGDATSIVCSGTTIGLAAVAHWTQPPQPPSYATLAPGIGYLRLPTFDDANDRALQQVMVSLPADAKAAHAIVFDLRGNAGSNAPVDLMTEWFSKHDLDRAGTITEIGTRSCVETGLTFGLAQQLAAGLHAPLTKDVKSMLQPLLDGLAAPVAGCAVQPQRIEGAWRLMAHRFPPADAVPQGQPRPIVVVDGGCAADCEYLAMVLAAMPGSVLVGASTYGDIGFAKPGYFVLPHSRVPFRLALGRTDAYGDGRSTDGYGLAVDVLLPTIASQSPASIAALAQQLTDR